MATTAPTATLAAALATRPTAAVIDSRLPSADFAPAGAAAIFDGAGRADAFAAARFTAAAAGAGFAPSVAEGAGDEGTALFGADLPKAGLASFDRAATAGPAPARA